MPVCPKGHASEATDYCDECGTPIGGAAAAAPTGPGPGAAAAPAVATPAGPTGEPCPECQTPRDGRFCETCGHDFLAEPQPAAASGDPAAASGDPAAASGAPAGPVGPAGSGGAAGSVPTREWRVVATADREHHERMLAAADADAEPVPFPAYCPERRFALSGSEVLIGRNSRSRGIEPGVDLTGPPEDAAISHMHALLVRTPEGTWNLVDLDSANGTYLNGSADPVPPNRPIPLADGDRIHVGAWTTLTVLAS